MYQLRSASENPATDIDWYGLLDDTSAFLRHSESLLDDLQPLLDALGVNGGTGVEQLVQGIGGFLALFDGIDGVDALIV